MKGFFLNKYNFFSAISDIYKSTSSCHTNFSDNFDWFLLVGLSCMKLSTKSPSNKNKSTKQQHSKELSKHLHFCPTQLLPELLDPVCNKKRLYSKKVHFEDVLCYVFTSGTTGLCKASLMTHSR
jgi:long-subunit acyl-CoA synthetase (AMP-forming)